MTKLTKLQTARRSLGKFIAAPIVALALIFTVAGAVNLGTTTPAEAGKVKIVKKGSKLVLKGIGRVGKKMAKSKNKHVRKAGKGMKKGSKKGLKGMDKASRGATKLIRKTKAGRKAHNAYRNAGRWKAKKLNKAFRKCRGKACRLSKEAVDLVTPL